MNDIVVQGQDGSTWRYHAVHGPEYTPEETGWVLVVENSSKGIAPQAVTAAEVLGDLRSMQAADPPPEVLVRLFTEQMIDALERRVAELEREGRPSDEGRERVAGLRQELAELLEAGNTGGKIIPMEGTAANPQPLEYAEGDAETYVPDPEEAERSGFAAWLRDRERRGEIEAGEQMEGHDPAQQRHGSPGTDDADQDVTPAPRIYYFRTVEDGILVRSHRERGGPARVDGGPEAWVGNRWKPWPYFDVMHEGVVLNREQAQQVEPDADLDAPFGPPYEGESKGVTYPLPIQRR